jgi:3'-5' exoribonuclease
MIKGVEEGEIISAVVLIKTLSNHTNRNNEPYIKLKLYDGESDIDAYLWNTDSCNFKIDDVVKVKGKYSKYNDKPKIDIDDICKSDKHIKLASLKSNQIEDLTTRFSKLTDLIDDADFKNLIHALFVKSELWNEFITAPAAKSNHQAYIGGLLQHSVEVAEMALDIYERDQTHINLNLLISACLLHDIGKINEYEYEKKIDRTTTGKLVGHTVLGIILITRRIPNDFPAKKFRELIHLMCSHHGKREWGAPIEPLMKEAVILHQCDMISSYCGRFNDLKSKTTDEWSDFDNTYNRSWYLHTTNDEKE